MPKKADTNVNKALSVIFAAESIVIDAFRTPHSWIHHQLGFSDYQSKSLLYYLIRKGFVSLEKKADKKFVRLTKKGELEILLAKSRLSPQAKWDGKWRVVIFDIPESAKKHRDKLRKLLKDSGFAKLQGSVFINPYPLNREAVEYLKATGLIEYIRILKIEEMDDDSDLRKFFKV